MDISMKQILKIENCFNKAIKDFSLFEGQTGVLVGFSGGADSAALVHILYKYCNERGIYLAALHINHGIRGAEADRDEKFCAEVCKELGIDFRCIREDIPKMSKEIGTGLEETARNFRYEAFYKAVCEDSRLSCVAVAHNSDDNAETVIFNLSRGCGIDGLSGISPLREYRDIKIIRPLILCAKNDIIDYCTKNGINYVVDSTNGDTSYSRNHIRHNIMPCFQKLNPSFLNSVLRMKDNLRLDTDFIKTALEDFLLENYTEKGLNVMALSMAHPAISSRAVSKVFFEITGETLEKNHINRVLELAKKGASDIYETVKGGYYAKITDGNIAFTKDRDRAFEGFCFKLKRGINQFDSQDFAIVVADDGLSTADLQKHHEKLTNIYKLSICTEVNFDTIKDALLSGTLIARSKKDGDSYVFGSMTRKLKKLFNDSGFDKSKRENTPVICDEKGILWLPGFRSADRAYMRGGAKIIYYYNK